MHHVPHYDRLLRLLEDTTQRVVELWGWRGTGKRAFLAELVRREPERTQVLVEATRLREGELDRTLAEGRLRGARWIVADEAGEARDVAVVTSRLHPDQSLVMLTRRRGEGKGREGQVARERGRRSGRRRAVSEIVAPERLLLEPGELAALWRELRGASPSDELLEQLMAETEGWLRPLELLAREGAGGEKVSPLACPAIRRFLEIEVLEALSPNERDAIAAIAGDRTDVAAEEAVAALIADWGLIWREKGGLRLPELLRRYHRQVDGRPVPGSRPSLRARPRSAPAETEVAVPEIVELKLLGAPELRRRFADGGVVELEWSLRRAFLVLAFLASSPERQATRTELVEAVWPEADAETVRRNFHPTISLLRRTLQGPSRKGAPALLHSAGYYRLSRGLEWSIDLEEFKSLVEQGREAADDEARVTAWISAWRLYRGHYLPGHDLAWVTARRDEILRGYLDMLRELGAALLRVGRSREAEDVLRTVLVEDPLQEEVYVTIMRIYAERGRRDLVRRQYERLCQVLLEELGLEPLAITAAEYQRLMA